MFFRSFILYTQLYFHCIVFQIRVILGLQEGVVSCAGSSKEGETLKEACVNSDHEPLRIEMSTTLFKMSLFGVHLCQSTQFRLVDSTNEIGHYGIVILPFFPKFVVNTTQIRIMYVLQEGAISCAGSFQKGETRKEVGAKSYREP